MPPRIAGAHPVRTAIGIGVGLVLGLVVVEAALQVAALVVWWRQREAVAAEAEEAHAGSSLVLCLGDSYTYGIGADPRTTSWPRQLAKRLAEPGEAAGNWAVRVSAWPGDSSSKVRSRLAAELRRYRPDWVCLLVGANDAWSAGEVVEKDAPGRWSWRWRTPRLIALVRFRASGLPHGSDGDRPRYRREDPAPRAPLPANASRQELSEEIDRLELLAPDAGVRTPAAAGDAERTASSRSAVLSLTTAVHALDDADLSARFVLLLAKHKLVVLAAQEGLRAEERDGMSVTLGQAMVFTLMRLNRLMEADRVATRMLELAPERPEPWRARAQVLLGQGDRTGAIRACARALAHDDSEAWTETYLRRMGAGTHDVESALAPGAGESAVPPASARRLLALAGRAERDDERRRQLRRNLEAMIAVARDSGARPLLLTYPTDGRLGRINEVLREVAAERSVPLIDTEDAIRAAMADHPYQALWVADGHCTPVGYGIVAEAVRNRLLALAAAPPD